MNYPLKAEGLKANDAKLGGKYRMSNVREFIALAYLLYLASERKASVDYSDGKDSPNQLKLIHVITNAKTEAFFRGLES